MVSQNRDSTVTHLEYQRRGGSYKYPDCSSKFISVYRREKMVRHNKTKAKIRAGEVVYGVTVGVNDPNIVELAGALGFDFAIIDCEHDLFNGRDL